jgi:hypothetical protein
MSDMDRRGSAGTPFERVMRGLDLGDDRCWIWTGYTNLDGYGELGSYPEGTTCITHRIVYEALVGPIPEGSELHHECDEMLCCNPAHLKVMTKADHASHTRRPDQTKCLSGKHDWKPENLMRRGGYLTCRLCNRERDKAYRKARKEKRELAK